MKFHYTPFLLSAFLGGVFLRSFFTIPINFVFVFLGTVIGVGTLFFLRERRIQIFLLITLCFLLGILRLAFFEQNIVYDTLHYHYGANVVVRGIVVAQTYQTASQKIVVQTSQGKISVTTRNYPSYRYGDVVSLGGVLSEPQQDDRYDEKDFLAKDKIFSTMIFPAIDIVGFSPPSSILSFLFNVKQGFEERIHAVFPEPQSTLAVGMLLGKEGTIDKTLYQEFQKSGVAHILVLSGYNITIVGVFIMALLGLMVSETIAWWGTVAGIILFTLMTGAEAPAVRAALMAIIVLVAKRNGRLSVGVSTLVWSAFLMTLWSPMILRWDRGFQLSFLATLGLVVVSPYLKKFVKWIPEALGIRESAMATISAQIFVLPLLLSWGGEVSFLAPIANILVLGVVPIAMFFSFVAACFAFVSVSLGSLIASLPYVIISFQIAVVHFIANVPASSVSFQKIPFIIMIMVYGTLFYWSGKVLFKETVI